MAQSKVSGLSSGQVLEITECSICSESFKEPKVLPCIHTFCLNCLEKYGEQKEIGPDDKMNCPLCRKEFIIPKGGLKELQNNYFMLQLLQLSQLSGGRVVQEGVKCELCASVSEVSEATAYCIQCSQHLCEPCRGRHKVQKSSRVHQVVVINEKPTAEELVKMAPSYCEQHSNDEIKFYCHDCKKTVCVVCYVVDKHNKHDCSDVKKASDEFRAQLNVDIGKIDTAKSEEELEKLDAERSKFVANVKEMGKEIAEKYDMLKAMLDQHQNELLEKLKSYEEKRLKEIETRRDEIERQCVTMESFKRYCREMIEKGTPCELCRATQDLSARTGELVKNQEELLVAKLSSDDIKLIQFTTQTNKNWIGELSYNEVKSVYFKGSGVFSATSLLNQPTVQKVINSKSSLGGIAVWRNEVFVSSGSSSEIEVYDSRIFTLTRQLPIPGQSNGRAVAACSHHNCLYVSTTDENAILHRFDLVNNSTSQWSLTGTCLILTVTKDHNLLVTLQHHNKIQVYTTNGTLLQDIVINEEKPDLRCSVKLSSGDFAVSQGGTESKVFVINSTGQVQKSYGGPAGSGNSQLNSPGQLSIDDYDNIIVVDYLNNRLVLLSPTLSLLGYIPTPGQILSFPWALYLDKATRYLYVGEYGKGRMLVLKANG